MKVLIISPSQPGIDVINEVAWASHRNDVRLLNGIVTKREVESVLSNEQFDIVHFAQHGNAEALMMSDGMIVGDRLIRALEHQADLKVIILNACDSVAIGSMIHNALGCPVIAHKSSVSDKTASVFAEEFYNSLGNGRNVSEAFREATTALSSLHLPDSCSPILLNGSVHVSEDTFDEVLSTIKELSMKLDILAHRVDDLSARMDMQPRQRININTVLLMLMLTVMIATFYLNITRGLYAGAIC